MLVVELGSCKLAPTFHIIKLDGGYAIVKAPAESTPSGVHSYSFSDTARNGSPLHFNDRQLQPRTPNDATGKDAAATTQWRTSYQRADFPDPTAISTIGKGTKSDTFYS